MTTAPAAPSSFPMTPAASSYSLTTSSSSSPSAQGRSRLAHHANKVLVLAHGVVVSSLSPVGCCVYHHTIPSTKSSSFCCSGIAARSAEPAFGQSLQRGLPGCSDRARSPNSPSRLSLAFFGCSCLSQSPFGCLAESTRMMACMANSDCDRIASCTTENAADAIATKKGPINSPGEFSFSNRAWKNFGRQWQ